jgi:hypothetical protein
MLQQAFRRLDPDARIMSAQPLHPAFTTFVSSAACIRCKPTADDEKRLAEQWSDEVTLSAPIAADPAAKTVPKK